MVRRCKSRLLARGGNQGWEFHVQGQQPSELPDQPPRSRSEIRAREVVGHGEREISDAPGHGQPSRRRVE